jgi:phosphohistidine phosphatase SixA
LTTHLKIEKLVIMNRRKLIQGFAIGLILATVAFFQQARAIDAPAADLTQMLSDLNQGGYVIVFRHGATHRDQADTDPLNPENVAAQRQLSDQGREQAKQVGEAFEKLDIPLGDVYTSQFYRAIETGQLISHQEPNAIIDLTEGGLVVSPIENERRAEALRTLVTTIPADGENTLIVTHKPNILEAFGRNWFEIKEGEASVFKPDGSTERVLVGRLQSAEWIAAAELE